MICFYFEDAARQAIARLQSFERVESLREGSTTGAEVPMSMPAFSEPAKQVIVL